MKSLAVKICVCFGITIIIGQVLVADDIAGPTTTAYTDQIGKTALNTESNLCPSRFSFHLKCGADESKLFDADIAFDSGRASILISAQDDRPYAYLQDGLYISLKENGEFRIITGGKPKFVLRGTGLGVDLRISFSKDMARSAIDLDMPSLVPGKFNRTFVEHFASAEATHFVTDHTQSTWVFYSAEDRPKRSFPLQSWQVVPKDGRSLRIDRISTNQGNLPIQPTKLLRVSIQDIRSLLVPLQEIDISDVRGAVSPLPVSEVRRTPSGTMAAQKFKALLISLRSNRPTETR